MMIMGFHTPDPKKKEAPRPWGTAAEPWGLGPLGMLGDISRIEGVSAPF